MVSTARLDVVKQSFYGRHVTRANCLSDSFLTFHPKPRTSRERQRLRLSELSARRTEVQTQIPHPVQRLSGKRMERAQGRTR